MKQSDKLTPNHPQAKSDQLSLDEIDLLLDRAPPATDDVATRARALLALDKFIGFPEAALDPAVIAFFRRRMDKGLAALEAPPPASGARIVKFYSSSVVVKTRDACFAFDLCDGFSTPEQRDRLVNLVDAYFISHHHGDHFSADIAEKMIARGKSVVVTSEGKVKWAIPGQDKLLAPKPGVVHTLGPISFRFYNGAQYCDYHDEKHMLHIFNSPQHAENNCYLVRLSGMTFSHSGENEDANVCRWAQAVRDEGWAPDYSFAWGMGYAAERLGEIWPGRMRIAVHEYQHDHHPPNRYTPWLGKDPEGLIRAKQPYVIVFWGECLDVPSPTS